MGKVSGRCGDLVRFMAGGQLIGVLTKKIITDVISYVFLSISRR